jgi:hypothetical protein
MICRSPSTASISCSFSPLSGIFVWSIFFMLFSPNCSALFDIPVGCNARRYYRRRNFPRAIAQT